MAFYLTFQLTYILDYFGILSDILSGIPSDMLFGLYSDILSGILSGTLSDMYSDILFTFDILSGILLLWHSI